MTEITPIGSIVIPITFLLLLLRPNWLFPATLIMLPFQSASVLNIFFGNYPVGIQPCYFSATLLILYWAALYFFKKKTYSIDLLKVFFPLILFGILAVLSAFIFPYIFEDKIDVLGVRDGFVSGPRPLKFSGTNISQSLYLIFFMILLLMLSDKFKKNNLDKMFLKFFSLATIIVASIGISQVVASFMGFYFPFDFFFSNPSYARMDQQVVFGIMRLSTPFPEPAVAAFYFLGSFSFFLAHQLFSRHNRLVFCSMILSFIAMILTMSAKIYIVLPIVLTLIFLSSLRFKYSISKYVLLMLGVFFILSVIFLRISPVNSGFGEQVTSIVDRTFTYKTETDSFIQRNFADVYSLKLTVLTWGLGVGWGSNLSNSFIPNILSTTGILGLLLVLWAFYRIYRLSNKAVRLSDKKEMSLIIALQFSLIAVLLAAAVAGSYITTSLYISVWLAALVGISVREIQKNKIIRDY